MFVDASARAAATATAARVADGGADHLLLRARAAVVLVLFLLTGSLLTDTTSATAAPDPAAAPAAAPSTPTPTPTPTVPLASLPLTIRLPLRVPFSRPLRCEIARGYVAGGWPDLTAEIGLCLAYQPESATWQVGAKYIGDGWNIPLASGHVELWHTKLALCDTFITSSPDVVLRQSQIVFSWRATYWHTGEYCVHFKQRPRPDVTTTTTRRFWVG